MLLSLLSGAAFAQSVPTPPCGVPPVPAYAVLDAPPAVLMGPGHGLPASLDPASCLYWDVRGKSLVVLLSGRFVDQDGVEDILARFGAVSRRVGMTYRSTTDPESDANVSEAAAVTSPDGETPRRDFTVTELADGKPHYFVEVESAAGGEVVYDMRLRALSARRLVLTVENVSPVKNYFIRLYDPGDICVTYYLDQIKPGLWGFYSLSGIEETPATGDHKAAFASQATALFSLIATMGK